MYKDIEMIFLKTSPTSIYNLSQAIHPDHCLGVLWSWTKLYFRGCPVGLALQLGLHLASCLCQKGVFHFSVWKSQNLELTLEIHLDIQFFRKQCCMVMGLEMGIR